MAGAPVALPVSVGGRETSVPLPFNFLSRVPNLPPLLPSTAHDTVINDQRQHPTPLKMEMIASRRRSAITCMHLTLRHHLSYLFSQSLIAPTLPTLRASPAPPWCGPISGAKEIDLLCVLRNADLLLTVLFYHSGSVVHPN